MRGARHVRPDHLPHDFLGILPLVVQAKAETYGVHPGWSRHPSVPLTLHHSHALVEKLGTAGRGSHRSKGKSPRFAKWKNKVPPTGRWPPTSYCAVFNIYEYHLLKKYHLRGIQGGYCPT